MEVRILKASGKLGVLAVLGGTLVLSGCVSGTTYGTGVSQEEQTFKDLYNMFSLKSQHKDIAYKPRPETLVVPEEKQLVEPLEDPANAKGADWPESPEERLARIRAEADENVDNPVYRSSVINDVREQGSSITYDDPLLSGGSNRERLAELRRRKIEAKGGGNATSRKYLSEPPVVYRQPAESAPTDELGESEWRKERRARREAGGGRSLF